MFILTYAYICKCIYFVFFVTHFVEHLYKSIHMDYMFCSAHMYNIDVKGESIFI